MPENLFRSPANSLASAEIFTRKLEICFLTLSGAVPLALALAAKAASRLRRLRTSPLKSG